MVKNPPVNTEDVREAGSIPASGRCPGGRNGNPFSILAWRIHGQRSLVGYIVHRVAESWTRLNQLSMHKAIEILKFSKLNFIFVNQNWNFSEIHSKTKIVDSLDAY